MTTTLHDLIDLVLEVGPPVEAGTLRLFPVFSTSATASDYLCGPEAEASGALLVQEHDGGGSVPELIVTPSTTVPLLLLEGETVLGAKQNRTLNVSVLCHPGVRWDAACTLPSGSEWHRWGAKNPLGDDWHYMRNFVPMDWSREDTLAICDQVPVEVVKQSKFPGPQLGWPRSSRITSTPAPTTSSSATTPR
jgi:hypothetical protein